MKTENLRQARLIAWAGAISFVVVIGFGRFAFTPILPMMLHDHAIDLQGGSFLASIHYIGYLLGAVTCMIIPWFLRCCSCSIPSHPRIVRYSLVATAFLILGMSFPFPSLWPLFRFLTGITSAIAFVYTSGWCLEQLAQLKHLSCGGIIYTGPGMGIVLSGLVSIFMITLHFSSAVAWLGFSFLAALLILATWNIFQEHYSQDSSKFKTTDPFIPVQEESKWEPYFLAVAYSLAGFGYIIVATFLPVIAREAIPESFWIHFFWPIFGISVVIGAFLAQKIPITMDRRSLLFWAYIMQLLGVLMVLWLPNKGGFVMGSILVGIPFNMISLFGMEEARRLRPLESITLMGFLTAMYGIGQILGPLVVSYFLKHSRSHAEGFSFSLRTAAASLLIGAILYLLMKLFFPNSSSQGKIKFPPILCD